jgi:predicted nuclease of predicted toxin-antitoxin system
MKIRFQADADLNLAIVTGVLRREPTMDFSTSNLSNLSGLSDIEVLKFAANEGRVLVSHDQRTMPKYFSEFIVEQTSAGVIIVLQSLPIIQVINNLIEIWERLEAEDWINRIAYLPLLVQH